MIRQAFAFMGGGSSWKQDLVGGKLNKIHNSIVIQVWCR